MDAAPQKHDETFTMSSRHRRDDEDVGAIRERMAALRAVIDGDVKNVKQGAKAMTDWRYYVKRYPWATIAVAGAVGYFLVPKRTTIVSPTPEQLAELAKREKLVVENKTKAAASGGIGGALLGLLATGATRAAMAYVGQQLGGARSGTHPPRPQPTNSAARGDI
jgi:hypothetical protein